MVGNKKRGQVVHECKMVFELRRRDLRYVQSLQRGKIKGFPKGFDILKSPRIEKEPHFSNRKAVFQMRRSNPLFLMEIGQGSHEKLVLFVGIAVFDTLLPLFPSIESAKLQRGVIFWEEKEGDQRCHKERFERGALQCLDLYPHQPEIWIWTHAKAPGNRRS